MFENFNQFDFQSLNPKAFFYTNIDDLFK
jgi:hypothetical protein